MLERIREGSSGLWAKVILGLVILSFMFAGVGSYINATSDIPAATVNGENIPQLTLERAYQNERARMEQQLGQAFSQLASNEEYLSTFRRGILDRLINDKLLDQVAQDLGMRVSDTQIRTAILAMPEFQIDGQFNNDRFKAIILQAGFQPNDFRDYMRVELTRRQVSQALILSDFALDGETDQLVKLQNQTRDAKYVVVPQSLFSDAVQISDEERNTYYLNNIASYDTEEEVSVEYVQLKVEDLLPDTEVLPEEVEEYYQSNLSLYRSEEERRVSHILIEFGEDEGASSKAAEGLVEVLNTGVDFASIAQNNSADTFSAENGGDLEWITKGEMDPEFEKAAFELEKVGDISSVVRSEFGFHIIKLTDLKEESTKSFEEVKDEITSELQREQALEKFYSLQTEMAQVAFEVPDTLEEVSGVANKAIEKSPLFAQSNAPEELSSLSVLNTLFDPDFINDQVNSDLIEVTSEHVIVVRIAEHKPQRTRSLEEVQADVDLALSGEKAQEAAVTWSEELLSNLNSEQDISDALNEKSLEWQEGKELGRFAANVDNKITQELFKLSLDEARTVVKLNNGDVALVELQNINQETELEPAEQNSALQRLVSVQGQQSMQSLLDAIRETSEVVIAN